DRRVHQGVVEVAASAGATPFMVVQAALAVLLTRLGAGEDIPLGTPVAGRMDEAADDLVGFFTNTLVLRTDTSGDPTFGELLERVRQWDLDAYTQQDLPFERLVEVLNPDRSMARHPLFQVMLAFNNIEQAAVDLPGLSVQAEPVDLAVTKFDLSLSISEAHDADGPAGLQGAWEYSSDLLDAGTAERMLHRLHHIIHTVINNPDQRIGDIDILQPEERTRLLTEYNDTRHPLPRATVPELFQAQAALTPEAIAVTDGNVSVSYGELNARANRLARVLIGHGVGPERLVGLALPRSVDMVVAVLAVLKAGGAYLPIDPDYPGERITFMVQDAEPVCVLTTRAAVPVLSLPDSVRLLCLDEPAVTTAVQAAAGQDLTDRERLTSLRPANPAYVIYTSGSTGRPKGVSVTHTGLRSLAAAQIDQFGVGPDSRVLQFASPSFDAAVSELLMALLSGAALVVADRDRLLPGPALAELVAAAGVTHVTLPPSALAVLPADGLPSGVVLVVAGEACAPDVVARWSVGRRMFNAYGPTESSVCVSVSDVLVGGVVPPIGRPVWNTRVYVLDGGLRLVA
ncbi:non-ribosomal peptide synthetase, partial [Streptomyces sp. NPDC055509]